MEVKVFDLGITRKHPLARRHTYLVCGEDGRQHRCIGMERAKELTDRWLKISLDSTKNGRNILACQTEHGTSSQSPSPATDTSA